MNTVNLTTNDTNIPEIPTVEISLSNVDKKEVVDNTNAPKLIRHVIEDDDMKDIDMNENDNMNKNVNDDIPTGTDPNIKSEDMNDNDMNDYNENPTTNDNIKDESSTLKEDINTNIDETDEDYLKEFDESQ